MTDITELTSVQKNANIHRLSRLIAYAPNDELRQLAVEVEQYTEQLIEALEKAQQPVVPDKMNYQDGVLFVLNNDMSSIERGTVAMRAWNACRAAMLKGGNSPMWIGVDWAKGCEPGNSPVIPDGYVMVPKEPTERMVIDGFESEPDETFSEPEVWEAFQKMSGCEQAAFRARLCWAAMLAAAPQENN